MSDTWAKKRKGYATIHTHPDVSRAVVESPYGVTFDGQSYPTVDEAKHAALVAKDASTTLSAAASRAFAEALLSPPEPNDALKRLMKEDLDE